MLPDMRLSCSDGGIVHKDCLCGCECKSRRKCMRKYGCRCECKSVYRVISGFHKNTGEGTLPIPRNIDLLSSKSGFKYITLVAQVPEEDFDIEHVPSGDGYVYTLTDAPDASRYVRIRYMTKNRVLARIEFARFLRVAPDARMFATYAGEHICDDSGDDSMHETRDVD